MSPQNRNPNPNPNPSSVMRGRPPRFNAGDEVEVLSPPAGAGAGASAWHSARIDSGASKGRYLVAYTSGAGAASLVTVPASRIRRRPASPIAQGEKEGVAGKRRKSLTPRKNATYKRRTVDMKTSAKGDALVDHQDSLSVNKPSVEVHSTLTTETVTQGGCSLLGTSNSPDQHEAGTCHDFHLSTPRADIAGGLFCPLSNDSHSRKIPLPFEKRSPMWKYIDLELMPTMRQHPHFQPLEQFPEMQREGIAVGLMVTYENLISNKVGLKMDSSCHNLDEILKSIINLEGHGFEVQHVRAHLEELVRVKNNREQLLQKKLAAGGEILERTEKRDKLYAELEATDRAAMALKQALDLFNARRTSLSVQREESEIIITKLQSDLRLAEEELVSSESTFQDLLTAAP